MCCMQGEGYVKVSCRKCSVATSLHCLSDFLILFSDFTGCTIISFSTAKLLESWNFRSSCRSPTKLGSLLLATKYWNPSSCPQRKGASNSCRIVTDGSGPCCMCSGHCLEEPSHWSAQQRTHWYFSYSCYLRLNYPVL